MKKTALKRIGLIALFGIFATILTLTFVACSGNTSEQQIAPSPTPQPETSRTYTVVWKNYDGTVLEVDTDVQVHATPSYNGATPTKEEDDDYTYEFDTWSPSITAVVENAVYIAQFRAVEKEKPDVEVVGLEFEEYGSGYAVTAYKGNSKKVVVPSEYNGKSVVAIGTSKINGLNLVADGFANSFDVEEIVIPDTVREIGHGAFDYCTKLKEIHIPNAARIGRSAFSHCYDLAKIIIDTGTLESKAFEGCEGVKELVLGNGVKGLTTGIFDGLTNIESITMSKVEINLFYAYFAKTSFTQFEQGGLTPTQTKAGIYCGKTDINGVQVYYNVPTSDTQWTLFGGSWFTTSDGKQVLWDGQPAYMTSDYYSQKITVGTWGSETITYPKTGYFYGYLVPKTLKKVEITNDCGCKDKFLGYRVFDIDYHHTYTEWTTTLEPSCETKGQMERTCTICGEVFTKSIEATGHSYSTTWSSNETKHWHAAACEHDVKKDEEDHKYGGWIVDEEPTCSKQGTKHRICSVCGYSQIATIDTVPHVFDECGICVDCNYSKVQYVLSSDSTYYRVNGLNDTSITDVRIAETYNNLPVRTINANAFIYKTNIKSIIVPFNVSAGNSSSFTGCTGLTTITASASNASTIAKACGSSSYSVIISSGNSIGDEAFYFCTGLTSITIPDSVTGIGDEAFYYCTGLTSITIPTSMTSIGSSAFGNCSGLTTINYTGDITGWCGISNIDNLMRYGSSTKSLYINGALVEGDLAIPNSVTTIPSNAFYNCRSLTTITIPDSVTSIGSWAFSECSGLTSITIPDSVTSIGSGAFSGCSGLTSVYFTGDIASWCAISGLESLMSYGTSNKKLYISGEEVTGELVIPDSVTSIGNGAFNGCSGLTSITIPDSVTSIGGSAFQGCAGLTSIIIPDSVITIGEGAFSGCSSLESITIPFVGDSRKSASDTSRYPFGYIFGTTSYTGGTEVVQNYYYHTKSYTNRYYIPSVLRSVTVTGGNILYGAFYDCSMLTSITIPDSVTSIGERAFYNCTGLTSVVIPDSVTSIGDWAFYDCSGLTSITIPNSVTSIGSSAFGNCSGLTTINYTGDITSWCEINGLEQLMQNGSSTKSLYIYGDLVEGDLVIPSEVTTIPSRAFCGCTGLTSITIPNSVTSIGRKAFNNCSALTSIVYDGTVAQWNAISKGTDWNKNTGTYIIHCTDGDIAKS